MKRYSEILCGMMLALIISLSLMSCSSSGNDSERVIDLVPVKLTEEGNWSMLDRNGNILFEGEFKQMPFIATEGVFFGYEGESSILYKANGRELVTIPGSKGLEEAGYMSEGVIPVVFPHERIKLLNSDGKVICTLDPVDGKEVVQCELMFSEGLLAFCVYDNRKEKWGFMDTKGKVVIKPKYKFVNAFKDGVALCYEQKNDSTFECTSVVIDRHGKVLYEVKDGLLGVDYSKGLMLLEDGDVCYLVDKDGKKTKLPSKFNSFCGSKGDYMIFRTKDGDYGVANIKGEICIRPKYQDIKFGIGNYFLARRADKDEVLVLNTKGEVIKELDYSNVNVMEKEFGYIAEVGGRYVILGDDFKQKSTEEFLYVNDENAFDRAINSDYFDPKEVVSVIMDNLAPDGFNKYTFGESVSKIFAGERVPQYTEGYNYPQVYKFGLGYRIECDCSFTEDRTRWEDDDYVWNEDSKLRSLRLDVSVPYSWRKETAEQLCDALMARGYKKDPCINLDVVESKGRKFNTEFETTFKSKSGESYRAITIVKYEGSSDISILMIWRPITDETDEMN